MYARLQLAKHSLLPSAAFQDTAVWTGSSGAVRLLEVQGAYQGGHYALSAHPNVPAPKNPADSRHVVTLSKLSDSEYRWDTTVDFAVGTVRPNDIASVLSRLVTAGEGRSADEVRAELASFAPRTSAALGTAFSLDSVVPTHLADGSTLPLPIPADRFTTSSTTIDGTPATVLQRRDRTLAAVVWVEDGTVTVVAGSSDPAELVSIARGLR